ncbi:hypothetical protein ACJJID_12780 [Microbulbifer sp. CnH-101-G]|uniref:hypothetical protein n=1 Tax=Microbulbifer sp. CnH-101-G TaxID=3243393 RepID=UPI004039516B
MSWDEGGRQVVLKFPTIARAIYSSTSKKVYVSEYIRSLIHVYSQSGELLDNFNIPKKNGCQFRGLNKNKKSSTGVSLLYFPVEAGVGNQWEDIEQFELLDACPYLGGFIDIYR